MFLHRTETIMPVKVRTPDARFGRCLLQRFGGATGEWTAAKPERVTAVKGSNALSTAAR
jgi:Mn-containing catalase